MAPDLVQRRFNPDTPDQLWCGNTTYIATDEGWVYLAAVIDLFSRQVVGWSMQMWACGLWVNIPSRLLKVVPEGAPWGAKSLGFEATRITPNMLCCWA